MRLSPGRLPPQDAESKWRYPEGGVILRADDKSKLIDVICQYRLRNNRPIGDIEADIDRFYCNRWPSFCYPDTAGVAQQFQEPMFNRVARWASALVQQTPKGGWEFAVASEADSRAAICVNCKFNTPWKGHCGGCIAPAQQMIQQLKQARRTKRDGNLSACAITNWENSAAVHLPVGALALTDEQRGRLPEWCWRLKL